MVIIYLVLVWSLIEYPSGLILFILGAAGIWLCRQKKNILLYALWGFMLAKPLAVIPFYVETRYRYNIYPLLALTAGFFLVHFFISPRARTIAIGASAIALFLVIASIDIWFSLPVIINKLQILL